MIKELLVWYLSSLDAIGYPLIVLLMSIESSILPVPSEVVIPPAMHLALTKGRFSMTGIVIAGTIGSWIGATVMYWAARLAGRPLVLRYGRFLLISPQKIEGAEHWAKRFGSMGIFISRLLPVVRHLIGIPAGIVRMDYRLFSIYTILGSAIWCAVLCWITVKAGQDEALMRGEFHRVSLWVISAAVLLGGSYYLFVHRYMKSSGDDSSGHNNRS